MGTKALILALFVAGLAASFAVASPPAGKGRGSDDTTTAAATSTGSKPQKVTLCQPTGSRSHPYARVTVAAASVKAHIRNGFVRPDADGRCPPPVPAATTITTAAGTTTTTAAVTTTTTAAA
jgi:hypothetical protein